MKAAVFIYYTETWMPLADIVLPVAARYCERHGYVPEFHLMPNLAPLATGIEGLPIGYYKMIKLRELMERYNFIWVLDCDALITNEDIPFHRYHYEGFDMCFTKDVNGLNAGSWIIKNTPWSKSIIEQVIEGFNAPEEQTVLKGLILSDGKPMYPYTVQFLPHPSINSYLYTEYLNNWQWGEMPNHEGGFWQPGDLCLHLPGLTLQRRIDIFNQIKEQL